MSRYCGQRNAQPVLEAAELWRDRCLVSGGSVFSEDDLWTSANVAQLMTNFVQNPDEGSGSFLEKLEGQLDPVAPSAKRFAAEMLWLMLLCPSNISPSKKREVVAEIHSWSGIALDLDHPQLADAPLGGIGSAGTGYNTQRGRETAYCIEFLNRFFELTQAERESTLSDGLRFAEWLEAVPDNESRQLRHMLLYLLFPDDFERIFGATDRRTIAAKFSPRSNSEVKKLSAVQLDRLLAEIRREQVAEYETEELDFYLSPLRELWKDAKSSSYLLTWNPANWPWDSFLADRDATSQSGTVVHRWNCVNTRAAVCDKAYLLRTGEEPRGIIAVGNIVSASYRAPHWDERKQGEECSFVDVEFTKIADPRRDKFISTDQLKKIKAGTQEWSPEQSGIAIDAKAAAMLDRLWQALPPVRPTVTPAFELPTNLILYGPPGTGKTYRLKQLFGKYTKPAASDGSWRDAILNEMTWFEVIFAALYASGEQAKVAQLRKHEWVVNKARLLGRTKNVTNQIWSVLQTHARVGSETVGYQKRFAPYVFDKDDESRWSLVDNWREDCAEIIENVEKLNRGPTGDQEALRRYEFVTFHQAYSYEDFVEGIRPHESESDGGDVAYSVQPGVFRRICQLAKNDPENRYAIFIDEINRGNIAKILGELITLLEPDKRAVYGPDGFLREGLEATLPYSSEKFGVPRNLDVIATMNTADRSIALLDTALRRRFRFEELMPDPGVISGASGDGDIPDGEGGIINLRELLLAINRRMTLLLGRDQALGHAYFTDVKDFSDLKRVLIHQVIPLLQEYFYEDWHRIQLVLRDVGPSGEALEPQLVCHKRVDASNVLGIEHHDYEEATDYWVANEAEVTPDAIRKIYENE